MTHPSQLPDSRSSSPSDPTAEDVRDDQILNELSVIRAHGYMVARGDRKRQPLTGDVLQTRMAAIDAAVVRIAALLRGD